jgi:hypothetical protein
VIAAIHKSFAGFQKDEVYVGTAEERAAGKVQPADAFRSNVGHLVGSAFPAGSGLIPDHWEEPINIRRNKVLANIKNLYELIEMSETSAEKEVYRMSLAQEVNALERINKEHGKTAVAYKRQSSSQQLNDVETADDTKETKSTAKTAYIPSKRDDPSHSPSEDYC